MGMNGRKVKYREIELIVNKASGFRIGIEKLKKAYKRSEVSI